MDRALPDRHGVSLIVSATEAPPGCFVTLEWKVVEVDSSVASVHLTSGVEEIMRMIEGVPSHGSREVLFVHPGTFTFTLTVTFGDGVKRAQRVNVVVREEAEGGCTPAEVLMKP